MEMRAGQGAMEYLMTYGWAILVVMIVGITMWQLGIFNMGNSLVTPTGFAKIKPQVSAVSYSADGLFTAVFTNGAGRPVEFVEVRIRDLNTGQMICCTRTDLHPDCNGVGATSEYGTATLTYDNTAVSTGTVPLGRGNNIRMLIGTGNECAITGALPTDIFNIGMAIVYDIEIGGVATQHTESGTFRGPFS